VLIIEFPDEITVKEGRSVENERVTKPVGLESKANTALDVVNGFNVKGNVT